MFYVYVTVSTGQLHFSWRIVNVSRTSVRRSRKRQGRRAYASLADAKTAGAVTVNVGLFINTIISFLIVAFAMFLVIRGMNRMKKEAPAAGSRADDEGVPLLLHVDPDQGRRCPNCTPSCTAASLGRRIRNRS